jgi:hypothetical protein
MEIKATRTLVKSEPELWELIGERPQLRTVEVNLAEKGFGTQVEISAPADSGLRQADLERILDELSEPQKRPFSAP